MTKLKETIDLLLSGLSLPKQYRDHSLKGNLEGFRDCHVEYDWILIYAIEGNSLFLSRTGTHADILD